MLSEPRTAGPSTALMRKAYARWAPVYDVVYDKLTEPAARAAVEAAVACGPRILEAGVGTGLSLGYYPARRASSAASTSPRTCCKRARAQGRCAAACAT